MKCTKCNTDLTPNGTYDPEGEPINKKDVVTSGEFVRQVYTCTNPACSNRGECLNEDGERFKQFLN